MEWVVAVVAILVVGALAALIVVFALGRGDGTAAGGTRPAPAAVSPTATPTLVPTPTPTPVPFTTTAFKVSAGTFYSVPLDLPAGTRVQYRYTADLDFHFSVNDPQGNTIKRADNSLRDEGDFVADRLGRYSLIFDNRHALFAGKNVSLTYRVVPPSGR
jgi:hypothetical protein